MPLTLFEAAAAVLAATAAACWINARFVRLPLAVAMMAFGLVVTVVVRLTDILAPIAGLGTAYGALLGEIDYSRLVLEFLLAYLLFAGAMNVDIGALSRRGVAVAVLATVGTVLTAGLVTGGLWLAARAVGIDLSVQWALVFGVLISPTDPIAVLAMTKRTALDPELKAQLEGEALFNDGVAVVLFRAALALAIATAGAAAGGPGPAPMELFGHLAVEALGGALLGLLAGFLAVLVIHAVNDWVAETLVTIALATAVYAAALHFHLSGPIGVVCAGLVVGSKWAADGMSAETLRYIHPFWHMVDEGMNAVLFFLLGLVAWEVKPEPAFLPLALIAPALVLAARWISIALPAAVLPLVKRRASLKLINVLTWAGVRGGLSAAMALSLPDSREKQLILAATFAVVVFSMAVQSLTMERLALKTGYGAPLSKDA